jgi:Na+-driven multidrug efflux pump
MLMEKPEKFCFNKNKLGPLIWKTSLPMFGAILALLLYDLFESSLLALSGVDTLSAIGFTLPLTTAMTAIVIGLSIRSNNKVVKAGCLDKSNISCVITTSLIISVIIVCLFTLLFYTNNEQLLALLGNEQWAAISSTDEKINLVHQQKDYMATRYLSWIFLALIWQVNAIFRALGHGVLASNLMFSWLAVKSLLAALLLLPSNDFFLSPLLGLAYVHVISDALLAIISLVILIKKLKLSFPSWHNIKLRLSTPKKDAVIVVLQQLITPISMALLTIIAASIDHSYVAAFAFIFRLESLLLLIPMVLTTSIPAIIGSNFWVGNRQRVKLAYIIAFSTIIMVQLIIAMVLYFYSSSLSTLLCSQDTVSNYINRYFIWVSWGYLSVGCIMVYQSCLNAKGKTIQALALGISHRVIFLLLFAYIGSVYALEEDFYQGMLFGHVINVAVTINDNFYQGILSGHIASGLLILLLLYKNKTLKLSSISLKQDPKDISNKVDILNKTNQQTS